MEIAFLVVSVLVFLAIFLTKSKKHANDARLRRRSDRDRPQRDRRPGR